MSSTKDKSPLIFANGSLTPSTLKLNLMCANKGPGMLTQEEIDLLRKSKIEISEVCQKFWRSKRLSSKS
jgi:hypothetical protein